MSINKFDFARKPKSGFTIVEMLIIAPIVILVIGTFISVVVNMTGEVLMTRGANALAYNIQDALNRIESDVKLSTTFLAKNSITPPNSPQGYDDSTSDFTNVGANGNMLILNTLATTGNPVSTNSGLVYLTNAPNACASTQVNQNTPMTMNVIYFVKNNTLWRRTIAPTNYLTAGCVVPWQQPSCNPSISGVFCKTQDNRLVDNVNPEDFVLQYFNSASGTASDSVATDAGQTDAQRGVALQSDTTLVASLNINKTIAGRDINQKGAIRSTRLDINATTIAPAVQDVIPAAPNVIASPINPNNPTTATFTWATVPGAATYSLDYRVDPWDPVNRTNSTGAWTNQFTNQNTTTFSKLVNHGDKVYVRVTATSPAGSSGYGNANITVPVWAPMVYQNGWTDYYPTFTPGAFTKTASGMVVLKGLVKGGIATTDAVIAQLPAGYAPSERLIFENTSNQTSGRVDVLPDGTVRFNIGSNAWYSLDGISFMPAGTSFNTFSPLLNSWVFYGGSFALPAYMTDSAGRVHTKGLVTAGVATNATAIATLPAGSRPAEYSHFAEINSNANSHISIDTAGNVLAKGGGNSFLSLQTMFYPSGRATGATCTTQWCNLTLLNGWLAYAGYTAPQYTKSSDGVVMIKGLVKSGNGIIANLPAGYCPKNQLLLTAQQNGTWERIDITAGTGSGCSISPSTMTTAWTSLDAISYMAEW